MLHIMSFLKGKCLNTLIILNQVSKLSKEEEKKVVALIQATS